jgi:hypothetical protein
MTWSGGLGRALSSAMVVAVFIAVACSGSPVPPQGSGDDVTTDVRDGPANPVNPTPADAGESEAGSGVVYDDAGAAVYPGTTECGGCTCAADTGYCFGGASPKVLRPLAGPKDAGATGDGGGLPACPLLDAGGAPQLGCNPYPAGCTDCACAINLLQPQFSCYLVCASNGTGQPATAYCPNP